MSQEEILSPSEKMQRIVDTIWKKHGRGMIESHDVTFLLKTHGILTDQVADLKARSVTDLAMVNELEVDNFNLRLEIHELREAQKDVP